MITLLCFACVAAVVSMLYSIHVSICVRQYVKSMANWSQAIVDECNRELQIWSQKILDRAAEDNLDVEQYIEENDIDINGPKYVNTQYENVEKKIK